MVLIDRLETHRRIPRGIERGYVAQLFVFSSGLPVQGINLIVVFGQFLEELLN